MTRTVELAQLSSRELEDLLLTEHGLLSRVLKLIREETKDDWRIRRKVEQLVEQAADRRPFVAAYVRAEERKLAEAAADRNAAAWRRFEEVPA